MGNDPGEATVLRQAHLLAAAEETRPNITVEMVRFYQAYQEEHS